jgi:general secretion pathway protein A
MYHQYFGLNEAPFSIAVNPRYLFMSPRHRDALAHLLYGVGSGGGFILLTGEVGTGKTTINRCLLEQLPDDTDVAIILNPALNALELLASACDELGIAYDLQSHSLKTLTDQLHTFLLDNHARGRNTVLMIDEAQHLDFEVLEQIRLLTNLETNNRKLLQIILIGQPELAQLLNRPELRQLNQRITARYNLEPLNLDETRAYIRHRLSVAGLAADRDIFPDSVVRELFKRTRGIPRLINVLCDRILLGAYGQNKLKADRQMLQIAAREVMGEEPQAESNSVWRTRMPLVLFVVLIVGLGAGVAAGLLSGRLAETPGLNGAVQVSDPAPVTPVAEKPAEIAVQAPEPAPQNPVPAWLLSPARAMSELWALASPNPMPVEPCSGELQFKVACVMASAQTWEDLQQFDRPIVLDMITPQRFSASALLLGVQERSATVLTHNGLVEMNLADLGTKWTGSYRFLWRPPKGFSGPLAAGVSNATVSEVALLFAQLDGQQQPLADTVFNEALKRRVILFQQTYALEDDGVVGMQTLLKLNELLGIDASNSSAIELLQNKINEVGN